MKRLLSSVLSLAFLATLSTGVSAKTCRDAHGKFMKCKTMMATPAPKRCRDAHGKYMKCGSMMKHAMHKM